MATLKLCTADCWKSLALGGCDELVVFSWDTIGCFHRGDDLTKLGLLMVVLSLIFMSEDHVINECKSLNQ